MLLHCHSGMVEFKLSPLLTFGWVNDKIWKVWDSGQYILQSASGTQTAWLQGGPCGEALKVLVLPLTCLDWHQLWLEKNAKLNSLLMNIYI